MFTYEDRIARLLTEKLDREREEGGTTIVAVFISTSLPQLLVCRRVHVRRRRVVPCMPRLPCTAARRRRSLCRLVVVSAWLSVEVAYLGPDISVKFHRSLIAARDRLLPPLLRVAIYLIHCLETLNPPPLHAPRWKTDLYNAGHQMLP